MKLRDYILLSDVDGTLLPYKTEIIPQRNIEAIKRFTEKGGKFGIATGRSKELTEEFVNTLPVNAPCVILNGGGLYDYKKEEYLMRIFLPDKVKIYVEQIMKDMPEAAVLVISDNDYYYINYEIPFANFSSERRKTFRNESLEKLTSPWYKVLFSVESKDLARFKAYINAQGFEGIRFVATNETLLELLPENSNKGYAIEQLALLGGFKREGVAAIGDYYNDYEMLKYARQSATTIDAPDDIKEICTFIAGKCSDGAVADFIEYLERICKE